MKINAVVVVGRNLLNNTPKVGNQSSSITLYPAGVSLATLAINLPGEGYSVDKRYWGCAAKMGSIVTPLVNE